jgi:tetratricopeptide (TPR) repeat protein
VQSALARVYQTQQKTDDAIRCFEREIAIAPNESSAYLTLAQLYAKREDRQKWKATLDRFLTLDDYGLEDDRARVEIADWLMKDKRYEEAKPYAYEAAKCYSHWALDCAARCARYLEDWNVLESCLAAMTRRYSTKHAYTWFLVCYEMGHENAAIAAEIVKPELLANFDKSPLRGSEVLMAFHILTGQDQDALQTGQLANTKGRLPHVIMMTALVADRLGNVTVRDNLLKQLAEQKPTAIEILANQFRPQPDFQALAKRMRAGLEAGAGKQFDTAEFEQYNETAPAITRDLSSFFMGWFLLNRQDDVNGIKYLKLAGTSGDLAHYRAIARTMLRGKGQTVGRIRPKTESNSSKKSDPP